MLLTCNIWKHPHEWKQKEKSIDHGVQCLHFQKKKKITLRGNQVMLHVDQRDFVKQKYGD